MNPDANEEPLSIPPELAEVCFNAFVESTPLLVYFKDREGRFIALTRAKAARHDREPDAMVGRSDADFFSAEHVQWARVDEESVMATGEPTLSRIEKVEWLDGAVSWSQTTRLPLRDDKGDTFGTIGITYDITEQQRLALDLEKTRRDLMDASRLAGMAEVATGVLHNVGNVLTSLNVSASVIATALRYSKADSLAKLAALVGEHEADIGAFITQDPKGRRVPEFIDSLSHHMLEQRDRLLNEITGLQQNIDHIKEIITMQQSYATTMGVVEALDPVALVEDSLRMNAGALIRHSVSVLREFHPVPRMRAEKAKVLQILVNLIRNAKYALDDGGAADKVMIVRVAPGAPGRIAITIADNGIGIAPENMSRIFQHGFTTRATGHGFGLHSAKRAAAEMDGTLSVHSAGLGAGASFTLDLPTAKDEPVGQRPGPAE
jgi:PAS domain S-box-containing protein